MVKLTAAGVALLCSTIVNAVPSRRQLSRNTPLYPRNTQPQTYINASRNDDSPVFLRIDTTDISARNATAPDLYGIMFEDINHSGDGGIYGELIVNRAFQGSGVTYGVLPQFDGSIIVSSENPVEAWAPVLTGWGAIGAGVRLRLDRLHPLSDALPTSLEIDIPENATGEVGFENFGWWGIDVKPQQYNASFYVQDNLPRNVNATPTDFTLSLRSNLTGQLWASTQISNVQVPFIDFVQLNATLHPNVTAPNSNNSFAITMDGSKVAGRTLYFNLVSLFPETFKGRQNGLRKDIADAFYDIKPRFLRFPGGNNLEGVSPQTRWDWKKTIGPLKDRPGRPGDWAYYNTDGLGLMEYLYWCEDMELEPVLGVYSGFSLDVWGQNGASYPPDRMQEIVDDAINEIEFIIGGANTTWGAKRAEYGHPEPFKLNYVEIGNEDWFSSTYVYRFEAMYNGLKAKYPNIKYISSAYNENTNYNITIPAGNLWDTHHYEEPSYFLENFDYFDNWQTRTNNSGVEIFIGEYSAIQIDTPSGVVNFSFPADVHIFYPSLVASIAEGVYTLGAERNPNVVKLAGYAPSLQNAAWYNWSPDLITFDANSNHTVRSVSHWGQWMYSHYHGTQTLPVTNTQGPLNPLFWQASIDEASNQVYLKVINTMNASIPLSVDLTSPYHGVNGTTLTAGSLDAYNDIANPNNVIPRPIQLPPSGYGNGNGTFQWSVPKWSINVLQFQL